MEKINSHTLSFVYEGEIYEVDKESFLAILKMMIDKGAAIKVEDYEEGLQDTGC